MNMRFIRGAAAAIAVSAGLLVAGCGGGGSSSTTKTAADVVPAMQKAVKDAHSVHMVGSVSSGSQKIAINLSFSGQSDLSGTIGVNGAHFTVLSLAGKTYIKLDAAFLRFAKAPASACKVICGKYVALPASSASQITGQLSMRGISQQMFDKIPASVKSSKVKFVPATFQGQPVLRGHGDGYTLDVKRTNPPYPVAILGPNQQSIVFSNWNSVTMPSPPPANEIVSLSSLG